MSETFQSSPWMQLTVVLVAVVGFIGSGGAWLHAQMRGVRDDHAKDILAMKQDLEKMREERRADEIRWTAALDKLRDKIAELATRQDLSDIIDKAFRAPIPPVRRTHP